VAVSPDGGLVSVTTLLRTTVLDVNTRDVVARVRVPDTSVSDSSWSPDGSKLILAADILREGEFVGGGLHVVDTDSWEVERVVRLEEGTPQVLEWSRDQQTLAVGTNFPGTVALFDRQLRDQRSVNLGEGGDVFDVSFSPDGRYLAAGRGGGVLTVLDTRTWRPVHESVTMHAEWIGDVEWLPDSNTVVTAGRDEMVSLYDVDRDLVRGNGLPASSRPGDGYTFLLPAPVDELVVLNEGGPGHVYPLEPAQWLGLACTVAGRDLTQAEWDRYLPDRPYEPVCDDLTGGE
jgi:WD40 repeat protein